ncbi:P-loop containing nucleoside triphosphate hydrolase protein [Boletus coccyginus]|nr:P-loop containing nucleoside triphosphate hydrolase protein [Boletus coccyginus]
MTSRPNSLDQFCTNERLQGFIQKRIFESHVDEYQTEGISRFVPSVPYFDNAEYVRLLQNKPGGLVHIMDDQARRSHKKTDHTMVEGFTKRWGNYSSFKVGPIDRSGYPTFTVNYFNGPVTYSSEGFLDRNLDSFNPDFVSLLRGSTVSAADGAEGAGSVNPFVKGLFSGKAIATQAHPKDGDTIVSATRRRGTSKRMPALREDAGDEEQDREEEDAPNPSSGPMPCIAGELRAALDTLFGTLSETQCWFVFWINPNDSQLPNQLEGRSVKGQIRNLGLTEEPLAKMGVGDASAKEKVEQTKDTLGLLDIDMVLGQYKVFLSQAAFYSPEDRIRALDAEEQKRNCLRDAEAEAGIDMTTQIPSTKRLPRHTPRSWPTPPFQRGDFYDDEFEDRKSFRSDDFDNRSRLTSNREETNSNYGSESYAPSRNMFQNADKEGLVAKEALAGEIMENETTEVVKETSARRRWVLLCWLLTWWIPSIFLKWFGRMKRSC